MLQRPEKRLSYRPGLGRLEAHRTKCAARWNDPDGAWWTSARGTDDLMCEIASNVVLAEEFAQGYEHHLTDQRIADLAAYIEQVAGD